MRIYEVNIEHKKYGMNWAREKIDARSFDEAVRKVKKLLTKSERIESMELLASTE